MDKEKILELCGDHNIFPVVGEIGWKMTDSLREKLLERSLKKQDDPFYLLFDTPGGSVRPALQAYDFLKATPVKTIAVVAGGCSSSGLVLLAGCEKRMSLSHSQFLFHAMNTEFNVRGTPDFEKIIQLHVEEHKKLYQKFEGIHLSEFKMKKETFDLLCLNGELINKKIDSSEAKNLGVIHEIITKFPFL